MWWTTAATSGLRPASTRGLRARRLNGSFARIPVCRFPLRSFRYCANAKLLWTSVWRCSSRTCDFIFAAPDLINTRGLSIDSAGMPSEVQHGERVEAATLPPHIFFGGSGGALLVRRSALARWWADLSRCSSPTWRTPIWLAPAEGRLSSGVRAGSRRARAKAVRPPASKLRRCGLTSSSATADCCSPARAEAQHQHSHITIDARGRSPAPLPDFALCPHGPVRGPLLTIRFPPRVAFLRGVDRRRLSERRSARRTCRSARHVQSQAGGQAVDTRHYQSGHQRWGGADHVVRPSLFSESRNSSLVCMGLRWNARDGRLPRSLPRSSSTWR